ncbi:hypothetical protein [Streptomyces scopuliridis]|uniref:hypothetical protein n=1 Tax=Streptomyces scopuliridis TaxID=452529 RepID=UPI00367EAA4D
MLLEEARDLLVREDRLRALVRRAGEGDVATPRAGVPPDTPASVLHALLASGRLDVGLVHQPADTTGLVPGPRSPWSWVSCCRVPRRRPGRPRSRSASRPATIWCSSPGRPPPAGATARWTAAAGVASSRTGSITPVRPSP